MLNMIACNPAYAYPCASNIPDAVPAILRPAMSTARVFNGDIPMLNPPMSSKVAPVYAFSGGSKARKIRQMELTMHEVMISGLRALSRNLSDTIPDSNGDNKYPTGSNVVRRTVDSIEYPPASK